MILDLINSAEVQRLRRIKQLGTSSFTFHGAEHSRFSHSLGVYEITRRICEIFQRNYSVERLGENGWNDDERLITLCALYYMMSVMVLIHIHSSIFLIQTMKQSRSKSSPHQKRKSIKF